MPQRTSASETTNKGGLLVVLLLGAIFIALLIGLLFMGGGGKTPPPAAPAKLYVVSPRVRIRTEPRTAAPVVATATKNDVVELVEDAGVWAKVKTAEGITGWAERTYLAKKAEFDRRVTRAKRIRELPPLEGIATAQTALYDGAGVFYPVIGQLAADSKVKVFTRDHDFYAIDFGGEVAYAPVDAIDLATGSAPRIDVAAERPAETTTAPSPTETLPPAVEPPPVPLTPQVPEPETAHGGVYLAVPHGGTQPQIVDRVSPRYPMAARENGTEGTVVIRAIVRRDGTVDNVEVLKDLPYGLGEAAKDAVERWRFLPATYRGEPIDVYYTVTVNFRLSAR